MVVRIAFFRLAKPYRVFAKSPSKGKFDNLRLVPSSRWLTDESGRLKEVIFL